MRFNLEVAHFVACSATHVMLVLSLVYVIFRVAHFILFLSRRENKMQLTCNREHVIYMY